MSERRFGAERLLLISAAAFGMATVVSRGPTIALVLTGTLCLAFSTRRRMSKPPDLGRWVFAVTALYALMSIIGPAHQVIGTPPAWVFPAAGLVWLGLGLGWLAYRSNPLVHRVIFVLVLAATAWFGVIHILSAEGTGFDVLFLHEAAADAIANGSSPYSSAVSVPNGAPVGAEFIVGYPYPPLTVLAYSVGDWTLGDPRWASLVGWLVTLAVIGAPSWRTSREGVPLGVMVMTAALPAWPLVLTTGWTESFSLMLLALAILVWSRPGAAGTLAGLFVGSKQYLLAGSPVYLLNRLRNRWSLAAWAAVGLGLSFLPVLIWGIPGFLDAAVRFHLEAPARVDGSSIVGMLDLFEIEWAPPLWLMIVVVVSLAAALRARLDNRSSWLAGLGALISVALFLSSQAFTNYWFLIAGIVGLAIAAMPGDQGAPGEMSERAVEMGT